jgi:hypothetical protein
MPYLHWATTGPKFDRRNAVIKTLAKQFKDPDYQRSSCEEITQTEVSQEMRVLRAFLYPVGDSCLHIQGTLDQYYYSTVDDADDWTEDQVVYRFAKKQHHRMQEEGKKAEVRRKKKEQERLRERERERHLREGNGSRGGSSMDFEVESNADSNKESNNPYQNKRDPSWDPPKVMAVNQLWMWIIDGGKDHASYEQLRR